MKKIAILSIAILFSLFLPAAIPSSFLHDETQQEQDWAEKQLQQLSLEEKIAQLLMIRVHSDWNADRQKEAVEQVRKYQLGGVCFFKGTPVRQIQLTHRLQEASKIPLLISIDGEWGPAMRLDSCCSFPRQMALGAIDRSDDPLLYQMGREIALQCQALGIHINFAPVIDVNNNAANPVINSRSFGENRELVAWKGIAYMKGMQDHGLTACAKHFPGHGDTGVDSHHDLPVINKSREELEALEFFPFKELINAGVEMIMVSHLNVPALDEEKNAISTLSYNIITKLLKEDMGFKGIVITDAMDMSGLRKSYPVGADAEIKALLAGVDILLLPNEVGIVIPEIRKAVEQGVIPEDLINEKCLKVLRLKKEKGLDHFENPKTEAIYQKLNSVKAEMLVEKLTAKSITLLKNEGDILPLSSVWAKDIALLCIGGLKDSIFLKDLAEKHGIPMIQTDRSIHGEQVTRLMKQLSPYSKVVVAVLSTSQLPKYKYGIYRESVLFINELSKKKKVILSVFGNPYAISYFDHLEQVPSLVIGYQPTKEAVSTAMDAIFGKQSFEGTLPVTIDGFPAGSGIRLQKKPLAAFGLRSPVLPLSSQWKIDSLIHHAISNSVFPGCQVLAIHKGNIVFHKNYGFLTYDQNSPVTSSTLYDIASITKSLATTLAVMRLYEEKKIALTDRIGSHLSHFNHTDKQDITIAELLTHTSGLPAYIPFYKSLSQPEQREKYTSNQKSADFPFEISEGLYLHRQYRDTIREKIISCKLSPKGYKYSDLGFLILQEIIESITRQKLDDYVQEQFYIPLGLENTYYCPRNKECPTSRIAPTEKDTLFRLGLVQGYVHDQTAALLQGVGGNAGLFSNVSDLAVLCRMLMNRGVYQGVRYFSNQTVELFTSSYPLHKCTRRGLGFDVPGMDKRVEITPAQAGRKTFGHQGFTGTVFWCDPENRLIYIFLSNRVYPFTEPNNLSKSKIRLLVHEEIYKGIGL